LNAQNIAIASSEECSIEKCAEKWCLKDVYGEIIVADLDSAYLDNKSDVFFVKKNNAWGIVSLYGKTLIPIQFDKIERFVAIPYDTYFMVQKQDKKGLYGIRRNTIVPCKYDDIEFSSKVDKEFIVRKDDKVGAFSYEGKEVFPLKYESIKNKKGILVLNVNNTTNYSVGDVIITDSLDLDNPFQIFGNYAGDTRTYYPIYKNGFWGMIDSEGNIIISPKYQQIISKIRYGLIVKKNDLWGVIDIDEKTIIPLQFQNIEIFNPEYSIVSIENHKQLYNHKTQTLLVVPKFDKIYWRNAKFSAITYDGKENLIENENNFKIVFPFVYQSISDYGEGNFVVNKEGKYGVVNINNEIKIPFLYSGLYISCGKVVAAKEGKYGILSLDNKELMPFEYRQIIGRSETLEMYPINSYEYKAYNCDLHCIENCE
jgi:hypothetical protein